MKIPFKRLFFSFAVIYSCIGFAEVNDAFNKIKNDPNALYAFLKRMPKGGELHFHLAGSTYAETMLAIAAEKNYCLNKETFTLFKSATDCTDGVKATDVSRYPELYNKTINAWSMKNFIPGQESAHDHFFATFHKFGKFIYENPVPFIADVMQHAANQHELYMEIMVMPDLARSTKFTTPIPTDKNYNSIKSQLLTNPEFKKEIDNTSNTDIIDRTKKYLGCDIKPKQDVCLLTVKLQYHILREQPLDTFFAQALHAFAAAEKSDAIVGVNLVQAEDGYLSLKEYRQQMDILNYLHHAYPNVHISLHAGELTPQNAPPQDLSFHINDAITIGNAERIGHGVDIAFEKKAADIVKLMADKHIAVEINLTSNEVILEVSGNNHPLNYYLTNHVPVVLSTDDEGILRTDLTHQYVKAVLEHHIDYQTLKNINRNAITYSFLPGASLWKSIDSANTVDECMDLKSQQCTDFVNKNEKARLQRELELQLKEFELSFRE